MHQTKVVLQHSLLPLEQNAIAIGDSAVSSGTDSFALGKTRATGARSFAVNTGTNNAYGASGGDSIARVSLQKQ